MSLFAELNKKTSLEYPLEFLPRLFRSIAAICSSFHCFGYHLVEVLACSFYLANCALEVFKLDVFLHAQDSDGIRELAVAVTRLP